MSEREEPEPVSVHDLAERVAKLEAGELACSSVTLRDLFAMASLAGLRARAVFDAGVSVYEQSRALSLAAYSDAAEMLDEREEEVVE